MLFFTKHISNLKSIVETFFPTGDYDGDEIANIDFENYLFTNDVAFAIFTDQDTAIFYVLHEVSTKNEQVTDSLINCIVDDLNILMYNANDYVFVFQQILQ
jgi:hypothetical protein